MENQFFKIFFSTLLAIGLVGVGYSLISCIIYFFVPLKPLTTYGEIVTAIGIAYWSVGLPISLIIGYIIYKNIENWITYE